MVEQAIEVIGINRHLVAQGGKAECLTNSDGYQAVVTHILGQISFFHIQHEQMGEIKATRLQHTHHLESYGWFAVEGHTGLLQQLPDKAAQRLHVHGQGGCGRFHHLQQLTQRQDGAVNGLDVELLEDGRLLHTRKLAAHTGDHLDEIVKQGGNLVAHIRGGLIRSDMAIIGMLL